jgi:hypothetical protein
METKKNKYDTNPLDPDVERASQEVWGEGGGKPTSEWVQQPTGKVEDQPQESSRNNIYSEAPTRRYDSPPLERHTPPCLFLRHMQRLRLSTGRSKMFIETRKQPTQVRGRYWALVSEKWAVTLAYAPYVGLVVSLLELFLVPQKKVGSRLTGRC